VCGVKGSRVGIKSKNTRTFGGERRRRLNGPQSQQKEKKKNSAKKKSKKNSKNKPQMGVGEAFAWPIGMLRPWRG